MADGMDAERRVHSGRLGCANCRTLYPIRDGVLDLRLGSTSRQPGAERSSPGDDEALRLAALLGLADGTGRVAISGPGTALAGPLAALVPDAEIVVLAEIEPELPEPGRFDRILAAGTLPFASASLRGLALTGGAGSGEIERALGLLRSGGRLVVEQAGAESRLALEAAGARILLDEGGTLVAESDGSSPVARATRGE